MLWNLTRKAVGYCKQKIMDHSSRNLEVGNAGCNVGEQRRTKNLSEATAQAAIHVTFWQRNWLFSAQVLKFFPKVKLKDNVLISMIRGHLKVTQR